MLALLLALFISSPCVLGVEFHFDCELRDASSVSPGELVLTANIGRLPTEAELIHELGEIYHLDENGLQGPFLRRGNILFKFGSKDSRSSWTIKNVMRYQALLFSIAWTRGQTRREREQETPWLYSTTKHKSPRTLWEFPKSHS